jgi:hypothetical protein
MQIGSTVDGAFGSYLVSKQLHRNTWRAGRRSHHGMSTLLLTCCRDTKSNQQAIVKSAPGFLLDNEHDILQRFQKFSSLRYLIDQVQDPSLLVLEYLDSNLLVESAAK